MALKPEFEKTIEQYHLHVKDKFDSILKLLQSTVILNTNYLNNLK